MFIANGAATEAKVKLPSPLKLGGAPRVVESKSVKGLKPGFFVIASVQKNQARE